MVSRVIKIFLGGMILLLLANDMTLATGMHRGGGLAVQSSIWKPTSLDHYPSEPLKLIAASKQAITIAAMSPSLFGISMRLQATKWGYTDSVEKSISFFHIALDIKQQIIPQPRINPFVTLGGALIFARDGASDGFELQSVPGLNVGSGIDFYLSPKWGIALEYQYLYVILDRPFGDTDNYTGPNLGIKLFICF